MAVPEQIVTNEELAPRLGLTPEQIVKSSGIHRRRWVTPGTTTSSLAAVALKLALRDAALVHDEIDYLIFGTMTPDRFIPGSGPAVQKSLGLGEIPCLDIRNACCNALYGLQLARALVASGVARHVAICLAEIQSPYLDLSPAAGVLSMLFGDGAAALIVSAGPGDSALELVDVYLATDGTYIDDLGIRCPGTEFGSARGNNSNTQSGDAAPRMAGQSVILHASRKIVAACRTVLDRNRLQIADVRWMVPHQANANLLAQIARSLHFSTENDAVVSLLQDYGNTSSASMGMALDTLRRSGRIQAGDYLLLPAFGAGFNWGAGLCRAHFAGPVSPSR
jgi:3-oxoacyl-[acyl-carrier-protein] synthase-3